MGKALAEKLGYDFYDAEIIQMTAGTTGYTPEFIKKNEEIMTNSLLYDLVNQMYLNTDMQDEAPKDKIFEAESQVVRDLAKKGNCVIVGRCADYILEDRDDVLNVFVHAGKDYRAKRIVLLYGETDKPPAKRLAEKDKKRALNYRHYTGRAWGNVHNYDLSLDSGRLTPEGCVEIITRVVQEKNK